MKRVLESAAERAIRYLESLDDRSVGPLSEAVDRLAELEEPFPDKPTDPESVIALLDEIGSPATVATAGRRYFGFVIGGCLPAALAANWLAGAWDQNAALVVTSPVAAAVEEVALRWLLDVLALPPECGGSFVTGTTMAHFTALAAARNAVLQKAGWDQGSQ